ncbi:urea transporter [Pedobacter cryoconitis]|uniref:Urea transporter n=1 Tax=Pedobacter cryoconitis TaxID=188932 RepID=A0A7W8ZQZ1_9SPHI|nr:urea transporter [Pedobacter cryoconitis]MBB5638428.1 urea transporter [Pedobacter cryoconitis]MBB6270610.1 urea transporter [Pedobacter cryoconitis]
MNSKSIILIRTLFRGIGQIMLQENGWTGALFLAGIFYGSCISGIAALLAVVTGTFTAKLLKYDRNEIEQGLYGFSAALVGVALTFYFKPMPAIWLAIFIGAALATILQHFLSCKNIPGFTLPFIVVSWILLYFFHHVDIIGNSLSLAEVFPDSDDFITSARGFGEVIFQGSTVAGVLFFLAVFVNKPIAALYGIAGALLSAWLSVKTGEPIVDIHMGLFSFNAVLCAITFSAEKPKAGIFVLIAVVLAVLIDIAMLKMNFSVLTFPFVAASWITLALKKIMPVRWQFLA